jgi:HK97 family phage portal protein
VYGQDQKIEFNRFGIVNRAVTKSGRSVFGEFSEGSQFNIPAPGGGSSINTSKALANNKGFVYAAVNAKAREVMNIDWRLFEVDGEDHEEQLDHDLLDLLDSVNDNMTGLEFKYLISACLDLTGNAYIWLEGVKNDTDKPKALHLMPPDKVQTIIDRRSWPNQLIGYKMRLENSTTDMAFQPYEVVHLRLPNAKNFFEGLSPVEAGAEYIDNDNYAMEFNRKFFINGARPAGFLESEFVSEIQTEVLKISFANQHEGIDNMNRIGVLPKGVKWVPTGSNPKDMDFKNMSEDMRDRILSMFGVSRTILGTAESDTNRATAETADYVFSKRVIKPHMTLICSFLNERLVPRYGDNLYITFIDPVPEDKAFRTIEMQAASGSQPVLTPNETRDEFMGMGPVEGGDKLYGSTSFAPLGEPEAETDVDPDAKPNTEPLKRVAKSVKAANGQRVAFRVARTKLHKRTEMRKKMAEGLKERIAKAVEEAAKHVSFSTKEKDAEVSKAVSERTFKAEAEIKETIIKLNGEQKKEVLANLSNVVKAIDPSKLFNIDNWISITTNALTPVMESLFESEGKAAAAEIGKPELNPISDIAAREALHESIAKMSESYNQTTLATLEVKINDGLAAGDSLADISKTVSEIYEWSDTWRAERVSKTEAFRTTNMALKTAWQQSGVVKTIKWYTSSAEPCPFCLAMNGKVISIDQNFFNNGDSLTVGEGDDAKTMSLDYGDVGSPPLHPQCQCVARPEEISID